MAYKPLTLKVDTQPTYFNKEALLGTLIVPVVGTAVGAAIGKGRMDREAQLGKVAHEPTLFNTDMLVGGFMGNLLALANLLVAVTAGVIAGPLAGLGVAMAGTAAIPIGAYVGGAMGKNRMEQEYNAAEEQHAQAFLEQRNLNAQLNMMRNYLISQNQQPEFAKKIEAERNQAATNRTLS